MIYQFSCGTKVTVGSEQKTLSIPFPLEEGMEDYLKGTSIFESLGFKLAEFLNKPILTNDRGGSFNCMGISFTKRELLQRKSIEGYSERKKWWRQTSTPTH